MSDNGDRTVILLVESHEDTRYTVCRILVHGGHEVVAVPTGAEALRQAAARHFDAAVVDTSLPDLPLVEFIGRFRAVLPVPTVFTSSHLMPADLETYHTLGLGPVLGKPYRAAALFAALYTATRRAHRSFVN